jgi:PAS domain S-box-containing protein
VEKRLNDHLPKIAKGIPKQSDMHQIIRKLAINKIELEMQWEALFQSHQELEEGLKHYIELYDFARIGFLTLTREGTIVQINPTCRKMLGQEHAIEDGSDFVAFITEDDQPTFHAFLDNLFNSRESTFCEVSLNKEDKETPVRIAGSASDDGELCRLIVQDNSEQLSLGRNHSNGESVYRLIAENSGDVIWLYDLKNEKYVYATPSIYLLRGYTPEEVQQQSLFESLTPKSRTVAEEEITRRIEALRLGDESARFSMCEFDQVRKDGSVVPTEVMTTIIHDETGNLSGIIGVARNISERKRIEQEKEKLQEMLLKARKMDAVGRIAGGIGHDFNNKLQAILAHTDLLLAAGEPDSVPSESLIAIRNAVMYCAGLTNQLLSFAKKRVITPKELDVNAELSKALRKLQYQLGRNTRIGFIPSPDLWRIKMDPTHLEEVAGHLITNALEAIGETGNVTIKTGNETVKGDGTPLLPEKQDSYDFVVLEISDTGYGMEKEILEYIYDPFFTTKKEGSGLGMSTVYGIVEQNNGFITAESEPGKGTTFRIYLPRYENVNKAAPAATVNKGMPGGSETILVVDDEESNRKTTRMFLESFGYTVLEAVDAKDAVQKASEYPGTVNMLLTDVIMSGVNGKELSDIMTKNNPSLKTLFISGYSTEILANQEEDIEYRFNFLEKPFSSLTLSLKVREVFDA